MNNNLHRVPEWVGRQQQWSSREQSNYECHVSQSPFFVKRLTGEEELGDQCSWRSLNNVIWFQKSYDKWSESVPGQIDRATHHE